MLKELLVLKGNTWKYLTVQIELLLLDSNTWNYFIMCKQMINTK